VHNVENMNDYELSLAVHRSETRVLISSWRLTPAVLVDRHLKVLFSNSLARALSSSFTDGTNLARFTFLHPDVSRTEDCWEDTAAQVAAMLRDSLDRHKQDRAFVKIVGELSAKSHDFSGAWAHEDVARKSGVANFFGTAAGDIPLMYHLTRVQKDVDDTLIVFAPVDDSSTVALNRLASTLDPEDLGQP
jgi:hypothetical protein